MLAKFSMGLSAFTVQPLVTVMLLSVTMPLASAADPDTLLIAFHVFTMLLVSFAGMTFLKE
jgi:hypothetical protein